jgi:hypothetical protein
MTPLKYCANFLVVSQILANKTPARPLREIVARKRVDRAPVLWAAGF